MRRSHSDFDEFIMRKGILPWHHEQTLFPKDERLISATSTKGRYHLSTCLCFDVGSFTREELISQTHNLGTPPDVPQTFRASWDTLKSGQTVDGRNQNQLAKWRFYWSQYMFPQLKKIVSWLAFESVRTAL